MIHGGDDRYIGNLFLGSDAAETKAGPHQKAARRSRTARSAMPATRPSFEEYLDRIRERPPVDHQRFLGVEQPVYIRENVYAAGASPFESERDQLVLGDAGVSVAIVDEGDEVYLETQLPDEFSLARVGVVTGLNLERVRFVDADYEERDGSPAVVDVDLLDVRKTSGQTYPAGPIAALAAGASRVRVW